MENKNTFITELFGNKVDAEKAYEEAIANGYKPEEINVIMSQDSRSRYYGSELVREEEGDKSMEGLAMGGALGGAIAGTLAAIAAIGTTLAIPGLGLIISGPLVAGLAGAGAGSISGGLIGALIGWGIPEEQLKIYERGIKSGSIILGVHERPDLGYNVRDEWKKYRNNSEI